MSRGGTDDSNDDNSGEVDCEDMAGDGGGHVDTARTEASCGCGSIAARGVASQTWVSMGTHLTCELRARDNGTHDCGEGLGSIGAGGMRSIFSGGTGGLEGSSGDDSKSLCATACSSRGMGMRGMGDTGVGMSGMSSSCTSGLGYLRLGGMRDDRRSSCDMAGLTMGGMTSSGMSGMGSMSMGGMRDDSKSLCETGGLSMDMVMGGIGDTGPGMGGMSSSCTSGLGYMRMGRMRDDSRSSCDMAGSTMGCMSSSGMSGMGNMTMGGMRSLRMDGGGDWIAGPRRWNGTARTPS